MDFGFWILDFGYAQLNDFRLITQINPISAGAKMQAFYQ
ncbi:hypothetical protein RintRC_7376 [Richelia intracellularis]|nr:hypothetical protein RintRC_7376 [Richelia intracellularis]